MIKIYVWNSYFGMYEEEQPKLCTGINVLQKLNGEGA